MSIVVVAHNEAERIGARIENLLALDYPRRSSRSSSDPTDRPTKPSRARARYERCGVSVRVFQQRRGKPAVVNDARAACVRGDIVVFADARQRFDPPILSARSSRTSPIPASAR